MAPTNLGPNLTPGRVVLYRETINGVEVERVALCIAVHDGGAATLRVFVSYSDAANGADFEVVTNSVPDADSFWRYPPRVG